MTMVLANCNNIGKRIAAVQNRTRAKAGAMLPVWVSNKLLKAKIPAKAGGPRALTVP
jgi:hypothetical protein